MSLVPESQHWRNYVSTYATRRRRALYALDGALSGLGDLGEFIPGLPGVDMNQIVRHAKSLTPSEAAANALVANGLSAISNADSSAKGPAAQPGEKAKRAEIAGHLSYYKDRLAEAASSGWSDLVSWFERAFVAFNAVAEVNSELDRLGFFNQVWINIGNLPTTVGRAIGATISGVGGVATEGLIAAVKGLVSNPIGLLGAAAIVYVVFIMKKRKHAQA